MRSRAWEAVCALFLGAAMANAVCIWFTSSWVLGQTKPSSSWTGVRQGQLDGLPSLVLTLAEDSGTLRQFLSCCVLLGFVQRSPLPEGRVDLSAADSGYRDSEIAIEGRLVLNIISRDSGSPHIIAQEAHVLLRTHTRGDSLTFQVKRIDRSLTPMEFAVEQTNADRARIHCVNCGEDAPTVKITKLD